MSSDPLAYLTENKKTSETNPSDPLDYLRSRERVSKGKSLLSALPKGLIKGAAKFSPLPSFGPVPQELGEKLTEKYLPTRKGAPEEILQFTGENLPFALGGEGGLAKKGLQAVSGGLFKKGAKDIGLPEWAQDIAAGAGMMAPDFSKAIASKALRPGMKQQVVYDFLKSKGLSEEEITPLIQNKKKLSWLSKAAFKYEKDSPFVKGIKEKMNGIYEGIREQGKNLGLEGDLLKNFEEDFFKTFDNLPDLHKDLLKKPIENLMSKPITFSSLMDFKVAVNHAIKDVEGGKSVVGVLKEPTKRAQEKLSPTLFKEQQLADESYKGMKTFTDKMTKKNWEGITKLGDIGKMVMGGLLLNPGMMGVAAKGIALGAAGRYALKQMLVNPRFQNIHKKLKEAVLNNKMTQALKLAEMIKNKFEKEMSFPREHNQNSDEQEI